MKARRVLGVLVSGALLLGAVTSPAATASAATKTFKDPQTGLSLTYPATWSHLQAHPASGSYAATLTKAVDAFFEAGQASELLVVEQKKALSAAALAAEGPKLLADGSDLKGPITSGHLTIDGVRFSSWFGTASGTKYVQHLSIYGAARAGHTYWFGTLVETAAKDVTAKEKGLQAILQTIIVPKA